MSRLFHSHDFNLAVSSSFYAFQPQSFLGTMHSTVAAALTQRLVKSWICCLLCIRANPLPPPPLCPCRTTCTPSFLLGCHTAPENLRLGSLSSEMRGDRKRRVALNKTSRISDA
ncbi:hypothetical protein FALCPG4_013253 [Fusarium falciforme]